MTPRFLSLAALLSAALSLTLFAAPAAVSQSGEERRERARELLGREDFAVPPGREHRREYRAEHRQDYARPDDGRFERGDGRRDDYDPRGHYDREDRADDRWERRHERHEDRYDRRHDRRDYRAARHDDRWDHDRRYGHYDSYDRYDRHDRYRDYARYDRYSHRRYVGPRHHRQDWRYHRRYYDRYSTTDFHYYDGFCRSSGDELIIGALIGALIGGAASDGDGGAILAGGLIGGGIGASLNGCDRSQYHYATHYAFTHDRPAYWHNPYSGVYGVIYARDYHSYGQRRCRWGDAEIYMPNGEIVYDRVRMCLNRYGYWEVARDQ
ncbi:hypothetical protein E5163_11820 [Marinicauda algicola]|uniref:17 kDa surface antigen n=1 Tax=Marinicauda algicola TaxID=2029849 RepID=A0A4S2GZ65_9PROT|nr:hypothetical protein [Marinicauda algicola]TGY88497.1 hypothetical protein E5163_11820 [Marinicauda algicola]